MVSEPSSTSLISLRIFKNNYRGWTHEDDFCRVFGHHWPKTRRPWERDSITEGEYAIGKWSTPSNQENTQLESGQCPGAKKKHVELKSMSEIVYTV